MGYTGQAGTYTTQCTGPSSTTDYRDIVYATGTLTVNPSSAQVTVTASSPTITYGEWPRPSPRLQRPGRHGHLDCGGRYSIVGYTGHAGTFTTHCTGPLSTTDYSDVVYATGT